MEQFKAVSLLQAKATAISLATLALFFTNSISMQASRDAIYRAHRISKEWEPQIVNEKHHKNCQDNCI